MSRVRAAVVHAPGRFAVDEFPEPEPGPGAVLLRMHYSGICGTDKHTWRGESLQYAGTDHERQAAYPLICGHENVGVIEAIGPGEPPVDADGRALALGDRVVPAPNLTCGRCRFCLGQGYPYYLCTALEDYGNSLSCASPPHLLGGWSELMYLLPGTRLFRVPDALPSELAALTELMAVTNGFDRSRALPGGFAFGDTVAVIGIGPLGLMHLAKAEMMGAGALIAVDVMAERLEHARAFGADLLLDASRTDARGAARAGARGDGRDRRRRGRQLLGPGDDHDRGARHGAPRRHRDRGGRLRRHGPVPINPNSQVCIKGVTILGIGGETLDQYRPALDMLTRHRDRLPFARAITHRVSLDEVGSALELAQTGAAMKVLVAPNGG